MFESDRHLKGSEIRLWTLIEGRCAPGADIARIDQRILLTDAAREDHAVSRLPFLLSAVAMISCAAPAVPPHAPPPPAPQERWASTLDVNGPLVGRIYDVAHRQFVTREELLTHLSSATYVLLGEKHDNSDHHRLQALVLRGLIAHGKRPVVAFEQIEVDHQPLIDAFLASKPASAVGLGAAVKWDDRGWPTWADYEPIAQEALEAHLPIVAANLPHGEARAIAHGGMDVLGNERAQRLGLDKPLPPEAEASLGEELRQSHCGQLPETMIAPMALTQRARDATMASLLMADEGAGAVLIAGAGHARSDRGVPLAIHAQNPRADVASVAFVEVDGVEAPDAYAARFGAKTLPFDYVWFTPRANDDDPCADFGKKS
ncbi:MAG: ChaN family lipoprotein [Polyangiaceae bacterium]